MALEFPLRKAALVIEVQTGIDFLSRAKATNVAHAQRKSCHSAVVQEVLEGDRACQEEDQRQFCSSCRSMGMVVGRLLCRYNPNLIGPLNVVIEIFYCVSGPDGLPCGWCVYPCRLMSSGSFCKQIQRKKRRKEQQNWL